MDPLVRCFTGAILLLASTPCAFADTRDSNGVDGPITVRANHQTGNLTTVMASTNAVLPMVEQTGSRAKTGPSTTVVTAPPPYRHSSPARPNDRAEERVLAGQSNHGYSRSEMARQPSRPNANPCHRSR